MVEDASRRALEQGITLHWMKMDGLLERAGRFKAGLVLSMGYLNPFLQVRAGALRRRCRRLRRLQLLVDLPDLPLDESGPMRATLKAHGMDLIALVGQNTTLERMKEYAAVSDGYVYVVSVLGTTGARTGLPPAGRRHAAPGQGSLLSAAGPRASACNAPSSLRPSPPTSGPTPPVFGSALLKHLDAGKSAKAFLDVWDRGRGLEPYRH